MAWLGKVFGAGVGYEVSIEFRKSVLQHYAITLQQVASAIKKSSLDLPAGSIKTDSGDILHASPWSLTTLRMT